MTALGAVHEALYHAPALVLLFARAQRQSLELYGKVRAILRTLGEEVPGYETDTKSSLELDNGSRVVCLPGDEATTRGFSGVSFSNAGPFAAILQRELLNFRVRIDPVTSHDSYAAWREGEHDDLVLATAIALWWGDRQPRDTGATYGVVKATT